MVVSLLAAGADAVTFGDVADGGGASSELRLVRFT
jgi:hypothetical protein